MHAQKIIQDFLTRECQSMHAKRRHCLAVMTEAARRGGLGLVKMSKVVEGKTSLRHRIKRCDRLLSNHHLEHERVDVYRGLARQVLQQQAQVGIIVDWSDLLPDISQHVLRATVVVKGRSIVLYEEVHPTKQYGVASVHRKFMETLRTVLPSQCRPVIITDAGFRAPWFKMLDKLKFAWIGRIRNRDMVRARGARDWRGCKELYTNATGRARDLGEFEYVRSNPVPCRLVLIKKAPKGRKCKTVFGKKTRSQHSKKHRAAQNEPWLLAVAPSLLTGSAETIVAMYSARMQIEQTFRDLKSTQWGMGLSSSQTRHPKRLAALLLIAALLGYALWMIGLAVRMSGYCIQYGSRKKAGSTLSILSLARHWLLDMKSKALSRHQLHQASVELRSMIMTYEI
ncbi:IS4 family transposase [Hydrogenophaga sp.]|uniref:IS4 family transposase n=1 Tax=Hydrogenophaga sp. TaxID=1904254 RepID=UPI002ABC4FAD|nr:IS4 family transposase [Hydrogenophaga sp.]MDZ4396594.1 IS4 family transposase [Hydrogenophaga sp.]